MIAAFTLRGLCARLSPLRALRTGATSLCRSAALAVILLGAGAPTATAAELIKDLGGASGYGTLAMGRNDDGSSVSIPFGAGFPSGIKLFAGTYQRAFINNNGNLTFSASYGTFTPTPFPITNLPMLAPYWGDVDTRGGTPSPLHNNVYYSTAQPGKFIVTWNYVGYYSAATNKLNAFQLILTDRNDIAQGDFDIEYRYEQLQWTTGGASGGSNGLGGTPAQMGYDAGDNKNFYRHPGSGTAAILALTTTSNVGEPGVWRFEVRGGTPNPVKTPQLVNVRLIETLNADDIVVDPASFATPPKSVTSADGKTIIEWAFAAFPANITKDLSFDVLFKNPVPGERRELVAKVELLYNDVNGKPVRSELGAEFITVHPSSYQVTPSSDKALYGPGEPVQIASLVRNLSSFGTSAALRLSVLDQGGGLVAQLGTMTARDLGAGAAVQYGGLPFSTGRMYSGTYKILAELLDTSGKVVASGMSTFAVGTGDGPRLQAAISVDKQQYQPFETVQISERLISQLVNASVDDLQLLTVVRNPDGTVRTTRTETLAQLPARTSKEYAYSIALGYAAAGSYSATLTVTRPDGVELARASTAFQVGSSAESGAGLIGTLRAAPALANSGQAVTLLFDATNNGNAALTALPLTVTIIDPARQAEVASFAYASTLAVGGQYAGNAQWQAVGNGTGDYLALLGATVGTRQMVLAQQPLRVLELQMSQARAPFGRVLGLVACRLGEDDALPNAPCINARAAAMAQALTAAGAEHTIVSDETAFKKALRSGAYNTYWLSGKQDKLHGQLAGEVREAVFGGHGAIVDSEHDQRNGTLDAMAGITWAGKHGQTALEVELNGDLFGAARLASIGRSARMRLTGAKAEASFPAVHATDDAAIASHQYGAGKVLQYALDLPFSLRADGAWQALLQTSLQHVKAAPAAVVTPGAIVPLTFGVRNIGPATAIAVASTLPPQATWIGAQPDGEFDANSATLTWKADLAPQQLWNGTLTLRAPSAPGPLVVRTLVSTLDQGSGNANPYGQPLELALAVVGAAENAAAASASLHALTGLSSQEQQLRERLLAGLNAAMTAYRQDSAAGYESAIARLVVVIDDLQGLPQGNAAAVRQRLGLVLREAQWRWHQKSLN